MAGKRKWILEAEELQRNYNNIFAEWRSFDRQHTQYIKSTIGLMLFGIQPDVTDQPPTVNYYQVYDLESRKIIDTIYNHITEKCGRTILLSCTYLILNIDDHNISYPVIRFCRSPLDRIYFTEMSGRYYTGWSDLLSSIQLPACVFIAPRDGLYTPSTPNFKTYKSPAATESHQVSKMVNKVATGGAVACTAATLFAFTPLYITALGIGLSAYGVKQSISALIDRKKHGQSISLDNRESILCYGNVVANGLAGASVAAVSNIGKLQKVFGNYANTACKVLNVSTVVFDSSFLAYNAFEFMTRLKEGTATSRDVFELSLQVFLVCGAVVQTIEMNRLLNQSRASQSGIANRKLTKTQKRNLQKRRAKARARGQDPQLVSSQLTKNETLKVGESDTYSSLKMFALKVGVSGMNLMMTVYPRSEVILDYYYELRDLIRATFVDGRMEMKAFFQQMIYMIRNLYTIIRQDIAKMQEMLRPFIPDPHISDNEVIVQSVNNEFDRINETVEEFIATQEPEILDSVEQNENLSISTIDTDDQTILEFIRRICSKYRIKDTSSEAQISFVHVILVFTTNYLCENTVKLFDKIFISNSKKIGEEKAIIMARVLGRKTDNDFYPTTAFIEKVLDDCDAAIQEFMRFSGFEYEEESCSFLAQEIFNQYRQLLNSIYVEVTEQNQEGVLRMTCILQELSSILENKIGAECRKISSDSHFLYTTNIELLGQKLTEEMMRTIGMPTTEHELFQSSLKSIKTEDIISELKSKYYSDHSDGLIVPGPSYATMIKRLKENSFHERVINDQAENNSHEKVIIKLVNKLYRRISGCPKLTSKFESMFSPSFVNKLYQRISGCPEETSNFESKSRMFYACFRFIAEKFITELKLDARMFQELKTNEELVGVKLSKSMLKIIGIGVSDKYYVFETKARLMESELNFESLVAEFLQTPVELQRPRIFGTTTDDDGFITYKITCNQNWSDMAYQELVYSLFKIKIDKFNCKVLRGDRCVVVKLKNKVITFNFPSEENVALVIQTDLECVDDQDADDHVANFSLRKLEID